MVLIYTIANVSVYNKMNHYKSPRAMCEKIKSYTQYGTPWVYYGSMRGVYVYYVGSYAIHIDEHRIEELNALQKELSEFYILTRKRDVAEVSQALPHINAIFEEKVGNTAMVLVHYKYTG